MATDQKELSGTVDGLAINQKELINNQVEMKISQERFNLALEKLALNQAQMIEGQREVQYRLENFIVETRSNFKHVQNQLDSHTNIIKKVK